MCAYTVTAPQGNPHTLVTALAGTSWREESARKEQIRVTRPRPGPRAFATASPRPHGIAGRAGSARGHSVGGSTFSLSHPRTERGMGALTSGTIIFLVLGFLAYLLVSAIFRNDKDSQAYVRSPSTLSQWIADGWLSIARGDSVPASWCRILVSFSRIA
jgi:hypothetical protein